MKKRRFSCAMCVLLAASATTRAESAPQGGHHRLLTFRTAVSDAPGENIAVVDFYADGSQKPDGSDLRVTNAAGAIVPMQVLQVSGVDDRVRIAFAAKPDEACTVTWGNAPDKPNVALEIKRGVFAEVYRLPANAVVRSVDLINQVLARTGPRVTASFPNELSLGYVPAGPQDDVIVRYTSQFKVEKTGDFDIALAVSKAGYVAIDGVPLLNDFADARLPRDGRNFKTINLTAGWHAISAIQINRNGGETGIEVAWRRTGDPKYVTIPAGVACGVARAIDGAMESAKPEADFGIAPQAEGFFTPDAFCPRYAFDARGPAGVNIDKATIVWDFGDGQTSAVRKTNHIFLTPGIFPVTLTIQAGGSTYKATRRLMITERLIDLFPTPPEDAAKVISSVIDGYDPAKLNANAALRGVLFYQKQAQEAPFLSWGKAWLQKKDAQDAATVNDLAIDLSLAWITKGDSLQAAQAVEWASQKDIGIDHQAMLMHRAVTLYAGEAGQPDKAAALAGAWTDQVNTSAKRVILAAQAYAAIAKGDGKRARDLAAMGKRTDQTHSQQVINQGVMTRNVEAYIRTKDYEEAAKILDNWEIDYPDALTEGYSRLQRVKLLVAQNRPQTAARIAMDHARALPEGFYAAELIYRAAEAYKVANRPDDAKTAMDLLKSKYPESPYAKDGGK